MNIKRPLCLLAGGFVLGEVLSLLDLAGYFVGLVCLLPMVYYVCKKTGKAVYLCLPVFCVFILGFVRAEQVKAEWMEPLVVGEVSFYGTLEEVEEKEFFYQILVSQCTPFEYKKIMVILKKDEMEPSIKETLRIGMRLKIEGIFEEFSTGRNPGEFDERAYYQSLFVRAKCKANSIEIQDFSYRWLPNILYEWKKKGMEVFEHIAMAEDVGIFQAAIFGEKANLDQDIKELYQKSGIAHLLAISGLHLSLIGMGIFKGLRRVGAKYGIAALTSTIVVVCYGMMTGGSASVVRATVMLICSFLASYLGRTYDLRLALSLAAILLLWDSPWLLFQAGFQLSFLAVVALAWVYPLMEGGMEARRNIEKALLAGMAVQIVTTPALLWHFYEYPPYAIVLNLLVIPFMSLVVISGLFGVILGSIWLHAGVWLLGVGHYILFFYQMVCVLFSKLPGSQLVFGRPKVERIVLYLVISIGILVFIPYIKKKVRWIGIWCFYFIALFCLMPEPIEGMNVFFLDVGQGDGVVIQTREVTVLIDGGSSSKIQLGKYSLEPFLKSKGIQTIDYAIVSHGHEDHLSGLRYLLESSSTIEIETLVLPAAGRGGEKERELASLMQGIGKRVTYMGQGDQLSFGKLKIDCLYPKKELDSLDKNEESLVLKVDYGKFHMLLTGDMTMAGEEALLEKEELSLIQVLKVAHHGSKTSTGEAFLQKLSPRWAVVSYGEENRYGHPHIEVRERMKEADVVVFETAKSGAIMLTSDGNTIQWNQYLP